MRSLKCSEWLGLLECSWFYFPSEYTTAFSSIKMRTFNLGPVGGCECTPCTPPGYGPEFTIMTFKWKSRDISLYCYLFTLIESIGGFQIRQICKSQGLAKNQVCAIFHMRHIWKNPLPKFIKLCMETPCLCPFEGHK